MNETWFCNSLEGDNIYLIVLKVLSRKDEFVTSGYEFKIDTKIQ